MTTKVEIEPGNERELALCLIIDAPRAKVYEAWTKPDILTQWFTPAPWTTPSARLDVRVGGGNLITMRDEKGTDFPNEGVYLEVVPNEKLVFTDAYTAGWVPKPDPFMTAVLTFEDEGEGRTRYTARVGHCSVEKKKEHEKMGFHGGWTICADQLEALLKTS